MVRVMGSLRLKVRYVSYQAKGRPFYRAQSIGPGSTVNLVSVCMYVCEYDNTFAQFSQSQTKG